MHARTRGTTAAWLVDAGLNAFVIDEMSVSGRRSVRNPSEFRL